MSSVNLIDPIIMYGAKSTSFFYQLEKNHCLSASDHGCGVPSRMRNSCGTSKKIVDQNHALLNLQGVHGMPTDTETKD